MIARCRCINPQLGTPGIVVLPAGGFRRAKAEITRGPATRRRRCTTCRRSRSRPAWPRSQLKDEAGRFGLGSFKALGGAYAVLQVLLAELARRGVATRRLGDLIARPGTAAGITVTCATDGNHGRSVAWGAQRFGARCCIFVHETVSQGRVDAIAALRRRGPRGPGHL